MRTSRETGLDFHGHKHHRPSRGQTAVKTVSHPLNKKTKTNNGRWTKIVARSRQVSTAECRAFNATAGVSLRLAPKTQPEPLFPLMERRVQQRKAPPNLTEVEAERQRVRRNPRCRRQPNTLDEVLPITSSQVQTLAAPKKDVLAPGASTIGWFPASLWPRSDPRSPARCRPPCQRTDRSRIVFQAFDSPGTTDEKETQDEEPKRGRLVDDSRKKRPQGTEEWFEQENLLPKEQLERLDGPRRRRGVRVVRVGAGPWLSPFIGSGIVPGGPPVVCHRRGRRVPRGKWHGLSHGEVTQRCAEPTTTTSTPVESRYSQVKNCEKPVPCAFVEKQAPKARTALCSAVLALRGTDTMSSKMTWSVPGHQR